MWRLISEFKPPKNKIIKTKLHDENGIRNETFLIWDGRLWWLKDKSIYVYYTPTHWFEN